MGAVRQKTTESGQILAPNAKNLAWTLQILRISRTNLVKNTHFHPSHRHFGQTVAQDDNEVSVPIVH